MSQECLWGNLLHQGGGWVSTDHTATVTIPRDLKGARAEREANWRRQEALVLPAPGRALCPLSSCLSV